MRKYPLMGVGIIDEFRIRNKEMHQEIDLRIKMMRNLIRQLPKRYKDRKHLKLIADQITFFNKAINEEDNSEIKNTYKTFVKELNDEFHKTPNVEIDDKGFADYTDFPVDRLSSKGYTYLHEIADAIWDNCKGDTAKHRLSDARQKGFIIYKGNNKFYYEILQAMLLGLIPNPFQALK